MLYGYITNKVGKGAGSHDHVVYLDDSAMEGMTSTDKKHMHFVMWQQPEPVIGPDGLAIEQPGSWVVLPAGKDGHEHDLVDYSVDIDQSKSTEEKDKDKQTKVRKFIQTFKDVKTRKAPTLMKMKESFDFYKGDQWPKDIKESLTKDKRTCLTINMVRPFVRIVLGIYDKNKSDVTYKPIEDGDKRKAELYSRAAKKLFSVAKDEVAEYKAVKDMAIAGLGTQRFEENFEDSLKGKLQTKRVKYDHVLYDDFEEEDLSDCKRMYYWDWFPRKEVGLVYDIENIAIPTISEVEMAGEGIPYNDSDPDAYETSSTLLHDNTLYDSKDDTIMVVVGHEREFRRVYKIIRNDDETNVLMLDGWKSSDVERFKTIENTRIFKFKKSRIKETIVAGYHILEEEYLDNSWDDFQAVAFVADKTDDDIVGMVEDQKDPQREHNKAKSQMSDILRRCAHYNTFYDSKTFAKGEKEKYKKHGSKAGGMYEVRDVNRIVKHEEGVKVPNELIISSEAALKDMELVTNIRDELRGGLSKSMPGYAMLQLIEEGMKGLTYIFKGIEIAKKRKGKMMLKYIQNMDRDRLYRLLIRDFENEEFGLEKLNPETGQPEQVPFGAWQREEIDAILDVDDVEDYDVEITETRYAATYRMAAAMALMEMIKQGAPISPLTAMRYLDLPEYDKVVQETQQMMEQQQKMAMVPYEVEKYKADMAAQGGDKAMQGGPQGGM